QIDDPVLSREAARGAPAPDRPQDGAGQSGGLPRHERLLSRSEPAGRRRGAGEDAGVPDQGRVPEEARRRQVAGRSLLPAEVNLLRMSLGWMESGAASPRQPFCVEPEGNTV